MKSVIAVGLELETVALILILLYIISCLWKFTRMMRSVRSSVDF